MGSSGPANDGVEGYAFEDFEQLDRIGAGGTADVYRASLNDGQERRVALKMPRVADHGTVDASFFDSFVEEASIWDRIDDHDNIVSVLDWGTEPYPWIAMEYMDAGHLGDRAAALNQEERVAAFRDVCDAVFHAHRHGIHPRRPQTRERPVHPLLGDVGPEGRRLGTGEGVARTLPLAGGVDDGVLRA